MDKPAPNHANNRYTSFLQESVLSRLRHLISGMEGDTADKPQTDQTET